MRIFLSNFWKELIIFMSIYCKEFRNCEVKDEWEWKLSELQILARNNDMQIFRQGRREEIGRSKGRKGIPSLCSSSATLSWVCKVRGVNVQGILETISKNQFGWLSSQSSRMLSVLLIGFHWTLYCGFSFLLQFVGVRRNKPKKMKYYCSRSSKWTKEVEHFWELIANRRARKRRLALVSASFTSHLSALFIEVDSLGIYSEHVFNVECAAHEVFWQRALKEWEPN